MAGSEYLVVLAGMPLARADISDSAVQVLDVVPVHECVGPPPGLIQIFEPVSHKLRSVLGSSENRFGKGVIVADPGSGVRRFTCVPKPPMPTSSCFPGTSHPRTSSPIPLPDKAPVYGSLTH